MDALALLHRAQEVGLSIEPMGDKLLIRGPKCAESVVKLLAEHKAKVLAALTPDSSTSICGDRYEAVNATQARRWRDRLATRIVDRFLGERGWEEARRLAWGDVENEWHERHGQRWPSWQCAGCDARIGGSLALNLPGGNRVHLDPIGCLVGFGKRWRGEAREALIALGLEPPGFDGDQL